MHKRPHLDQAKSQAACGANKQFQTQAKAPNSTFPEFERMRFPRTLEEAFGPYARGPVYAPKEKMPIADKVFIAAGLIGLLVMFAVVAFGY